MPVAFGQVAQHLRFEFLSILEVPRGQDVPLEGGEDQFHLIQPRGVDRQPMDADFEREPESPKPRLELFGGMGRPIVQAQVHEADLLTPEAAQEHLEEPLEVHEALTLKTPRQGFPLMDQQRGEEVQDALPRVARAHSQGRTRVGSDDPTGDPQRLDTRFLIRTDDDRALLDEHVGMLVEPQHDRGLLQEAGIRGLLPRAVLPGFDVVLA